MVAVAVQAVRIEVAEAQAVAIHVQGVGTRPVAVERDALARDPEVRQDEAGEERRRAEAREVGLGQVVARPEFGEERLLLVHGLARRVREETGNPKHDAVSGGLVVPEIPVLEVAPVLVAGTGGGRVLLQGEAPAHLPGHGPGVGEFRGEAPPLGRGLAKLLGEVLVAHRREEDALRRPSRELPRQLPDLLRIVREGQEFRLVELVQESGHATIRRLPFLHDSFPFHPKWAESPNQNGPEVG